MNDSNLRGVSVADALIAWTTSAALVALGVIFFEDAVIMGRTILTLGLLSASNEVLEMRAAGPVGDYRRLRLGLAPKLRGIHIGGLSIPPAPLVKSGQDSAPEPKEPDHHEPGTQCNGQEPEFREPGALLLGRPYSNQHYHGLPPPFSPLAAPIGSAARK
jgi:hypothetical protein